MRYLNTMLLLAALPVIGRADAVITYWDFGPDAAGYTEQATLDHTAGASVLDVLNIGNSYDVDGQSGVSFEDAAGTSHSAGRAMAWEGGVNDGTNQWVMTLNLTGYENIALRWDYRSTSTGPDTAQLDYRIDSGDWTPIEVLSLTDDSAFHVYEKDLTALTAINHQPAVQFRLSGFSGGSGSGTHRIDNLQVSGIPEPAVISIILITALTALAGKRIFG